MSQENADDLDERIREAEERWKEVGYYKQLSTEQLFDDTGPIADRVNARVRDFARHEIAIIVGGASADIPGLDKDQAGRLAALAVLTDDQVSVLVRLATTLDASQVTALIAILSRVMADPSAVKSVLSPALRKLPPPAEAPKAPAVAPRPASSPKRPTLLTPPKASAPAKKSSVPAVVAPAPAESPPEEERKPTPTARIRSAHSKPFPDVDTFAATTERNAEGAVKAAKFDMQAQASAANLRNQMEQDNE